MMDSESFRFEEVDGKIRKVPSN